MNSEIQLLDVVALTEELPDHWLGKGQDGTVVEMLDAGVYKFESWDNQGRVT